MGNLEGTEMTTQSEFRRDEVLFHQGSAADYVLRIVAGEVAVLRELDGASVLLGHARAGEWLGEMAAIEARSHSATARAVTDGAVEMLTTEQFLDLITRDPGLARDVILRLSSRLRLADDKIASEALAAVHDLHQESGARPDTDFVDQTTILLTAKTDALRVRLGATAIPIGKLPFVVGRIHLEQEGVSASVPDLLIEDGPPFRLSRQHFMITRSGQQLLISDLGSTLGTVVNGQAIGHHFMRDTAPLIHGENDVLAGGRGSLFEFVVSVA
jgi:CRP/FNR family cyclic AMP-dependent transcriptional regulator